MTLLRHIRRIPFWVLAVAAAGLSLIAARAASGGLRPEKFARIDQAIEAAIARQACPGAVIRIEREEQSYHRAYGERATEPRREAMTEDTLFDLASLTKVVATAPSILLLVERGQLQLDDLASRSLPEFRPGSNPGVTIRHLLTHTSGLRASIPSQPEWSGLAAGIARACQERPTQAPGTLFRYSDVNFILLGEIVRRVSGRALNEFAEREIFQRLGMGDTRFLPSTELRGRIAPTERVADQLLRGVVHDPTARRMGGVAGHAGLFSTASDLGRFARMMLHGGQLDGVRVFRPETIALMTRVNSNEKLVARRGLGWDIDSPYSRPRGQWFPLGSYGHTGWTGTCLWIDPFSRTFFIFLSNRVHPDGRGNVLSLYAELGTRAAEAVADFDFQHVAGALPFRTNYFPAERGIESAAPVRNGIDVLAQQNFGPLKNLRLGLVTNPTGVNVHREPTIDLLKAAPDVHLRVLFTPEHGLRGERDEGVTNSVDAKTGLPVYSLYPPVPARKTNQSQADYDAIVARSRRPSPEHLAKLDALVFDIQDIGCRFYTYIATLRHCLEAAAEQHLKIFVLDRPNPINGLAVEGPVYHGAPRFTATHSLPLRHGMTVGELARMMNAEANIQADLTVIPMEGWKRAMWFDQTGQPWVRPSPNMRNLNAAALYPGLGLHETALSVGRGTESPFEIVGAPYIDEVRLVEELKRAGLAGVKFAPIRFTPASSTFSKRECRGVSFVVTQRDQLRPVELGVTLALILHRLYPTEFALEKVQVLLQDAATLNAIRNGKDLAAIQELWSRDLKEFVRRRESFLIYP